VRATCRRFNWDAEDTEVKHVQIIYPFANNSRSPVAIFDCRKFLLVLGDVINNEWQTNGKVIVLRMPP